MSSDTNGADAAPAWALGEAPTGRLALIRDTIRGFGLLRKTPYGLTPILLLCLIVLVETLDDGAFNLGLPKFIERGIDFYSIITIVSAIGFVGIFANLVLGYFAERVGRVPFLSIGTAISGVACMFTGFSMRTGTLSIARSIDTGIGTEAANVPIFALAADYYPTETRVRVFSLASTATTVGSIALGPLSAIGIDKFGLEHFFLFVGIVLVVAAVLVQVFLREPARGGMEKREGGLSAAEAVIEDEPLSFGETWRSVFAIRTVRRLFIGDVLSGFDYVPAALFTVFLFQVYNLSILEISLFSLPSAIVGVVSRITLGAKIDRLLGGSAQTVFLIGGFLSVLGALATVGYGLELPIPVLIAVACGLQIGSSLIGPAYGAIYSEVLPGRLRTLGNQITGLAQVPGLIIGQSLFTVILTKHGFAPVYYVDGGFLLAGAFAYLTAGQFFELDKANALAATVAKQKWQLAKLADQADMLTCSGVKVAYEGVPVLFGVDFTMNEGEIVALLGTNGAGKSTLLRAICGTQEASGGAILFEGRDITHMPTHEIAVRSVVQMPGGKGVFPDLSVRENLLLGGWTRTGDPSVSKETNELLTLFPALRSRLDEPAGVLSGGEQQMLALALAFLMKPKLLLIDELSLGLSPAAVGLLVDAVRRIHQSGVSVIVVEQSIELALQLAERAVFMEKGQVRFDGPTEELLRRPDIVRAIYLAGSNAATPVRRTGMPSLTTKDSGPPDLVVSGLTKTYGGVTALTDVSFTLGHREVLGIIGPNGSGKTTLFDALSGLVPVDGGTVNMLGTDVTNLSPDARSRLGLVRRFQDARQFPTLSVFETLLLALENQLTVRNPLATSISLPKARRSERRARARADEVIDLLELGVYRDKPTGELSTGLRRIVDLGCVIAASPKVLLLDEPSTGIAQSEAEGMGPLIKRVQRESECSIIIIEHHMALLQSVSDRFLALALGEVITTGEPTAVLNDPLVLSAYLGQEAATV